MRHTIPAVLACICLLTGCVGSLNQSNILGATTNLVKAAAVSDAELASVSAQMRQRDDAANKVAPASSAYARRLAHITERFTSVNGIPLSYKVYLTNQVNANAAPDGSVRVFSGLMDLMTDDELRFVIGHEIGHVALGHSKSRLRTAYAAAAARQAAGIYGQGASILSAGTLGDIAEKFVNAQYSQSNELEADAYGMRLLTDNGYPPQAAMSALGKLQGSGGFFSTHPGSRERVEKIRQAIARSSETASR